jgi:DNA-directed RNA polymerase specialized sigma24 family protein
MLKNAQDMNSELEWMLHSTEVDNAVLLEALLHRYYPGLYQLTLLVTDDPLMAMMAAGQALTTAVARRHRYTGETSLRAWIYAMAYRGIRKVRKENRPAEEMGGKWDLSNDQIDPDEQERLLGVLRELDIKHILPMVLRYLHGLSLGEVAHVLGIRERHAHTRLDSIRRQCQGALYPDSPRNLPHAEIEELMREALDGLLDEKGDFNNIARLEMHLDECGQCKGFSNRLSVLEGRIKACVPRLWSIPAVPEPEIQDLMGIMNQEAGWQCRRQSFSRSLQGLSLAIILVALLAFVAVTTDIFAQVPPPKITIVETVIVRQTQMVQEESFPYLVPKKSSELASPGPPTRYRPRPTGVGPSTRQDGYPLLSGEFLPPRIKLNLETSWTQLPPMADSLGWNNSGPLSLYTVLGFWSWQGQLLDILNDLQPDLQDLHVQPAEMVDFVSRQTNLASLWRAGGDLPTLKLLLAGGYPVIIAHGFEDSDGEGWFAGYAVMHGYDEQKGIVRLTKGIPGVETDKEVLFDDFMHLWRGLNFTFVVVYPPQQESRLTELLGPYADWNYGLENASRQGAAEITRLAGRDKFFAAFNHGASHAYLGEYQQAAAAFDQALLIYMGLPDQERPWRIFWYEISPVLVYQVVHHFEETDLAFDPLLVFDEQILSVDDYACPPPGEDLPSGQGGGGSPTLSSEITTGRNILRQIICAAR